MIITAKNYILGLLEQVGISKQAVFDGRLSGQSRMKPRLYAEIKKPEPEQYSPNFERLYKDEGGERTYHTKEYDVLVSFEIQIGGMSDQEVNQKKREFLRLLDRSITDDDGYRIGVIPQAADLNPEESDLGDESVVVIRLGFTGGLWKKKVKKLITDISIEGHIIKTNKEWEGAT